MAVVAFLVGRVRVTLHVWRHLLTFTSLGHGSVIDIQVRSVEVRCTCGRLYYRYWTS